MDGISRRGFIGGISSLGAVVAHGDANPPNATNGATVADAQKSVSRAGRLIASAPVLQNAAETTMGVAFAVSADASGWVEISRSPDMRCADTVYR